jgi:N-acetylmuramic acid 6-phosphate etherase
VYLLFFTAQRYSELMGIKNRESNEGSTEALPENDLHVDKLQTSDALSLMLESQAGAIPALQAALPAIEKAAIAAYHKLSMTSHGRLIYAGAGTSARIGFQDGAELLPTFSWPKSRIEFLIAGGQLALLGAIENAEDDADAGATDFAKIEAGVDDVVIGLAASGQTPYTLGVMSAAQNAGAITIGIANNPDTPLLKATSYPILLATGGEIIAGSTRLKAGTSQKICLNLISNIIMVKMGFVANGMMVAMVPTNEKLRRRREQIDISLIKHPSINS